MRPRPKTQQQLSPDRHWEPADWQCIAIITALVALFFHQILLGNAFLWEDFLFQWYPFRQFAATTMASGEMPLWNPFTFNGMPFLADVQTQIFYLPLTALTLVVRDGHLHVLWLEFVNIAHYVVAGVGMFYLAKSFKLRQVPALFAGVAFAFSGFMITHAIHQVMITLVCWYPWVLFLFRKSLEGDRWLWVFVTGIVLGHSFFAGFPQLSLFLYFFLAVFFLFELLTGVGPQRLFTRPALVMCAKAATIVLVSVGLIMIQLLPTMELSQLSARAQITVEKSIEGSLAWSQLLTLLFPKFFGVADASGYNYWGPGTYWYYWETCIYVGILPVMLALLSVALVKRNKYIPFFLGFSLFSICFALGGNFVVQKFFFYYVPGFSTFRNPSRMSVFFAFGVALLSAFALQHLLYDRRTPRDDKPMKTILYACLGVGIILWALVVSASLSGSFPFLRQESTFVFVKKEAQIALVFVLLGGGILVWLIRKGAAVWGVGLAAVALAFIDMFIFGSGHNSSAINPEEYFKRAEPIVRFLKQDSEIFRVNTRNSDGMIMDRNQGMVDRIFTMEGYTPLVLQRAYPPLASTDQTSDLLNVKYVTVTDAQRRMLHLQRHDTFFPRAFMLYAVHVVKSEEELLAYVKSPEFNHRTTAVLEKEPSMSFPTPSETPRWNTRIADYRNNSIVVNAETSHDGLLVLSEIYYPGWKAYVDGQEVEILRADYNLRGICITKGKHEVEVRFEPASYSRGRMFTLVTLMLCVVGIGTSVVRARRVPASRIAS